MDLATLALFVDVARRGSFAAAARGRGVDPSSASRAVSGLESELGVTLFTRTTRRLSLTDAGEEYFRRVEPLVDELAQAAEAAQTSAAKPQGTLRVLAPVSLGLLNLVPLLPAWQARHPKVRIELMLSDALLELVEERIDVALRLGPLEPSSYTCRKLTAMWPRVCASPGYVKTHGRPKTPADLSKHACLLLDMPGFGNRWLFRDHYGVEAAVDVDGPVRTSNAIALKELALADAGVILQGDWIVGRELLAGTLVDLFPDHEVTAGTFGNAVWLLQPPRPRVPLKVRAFVDYLAEQFRDGPPWAARRERAKR